MSELPNQVGCRNSWRRFWLLLGMFFVAFCVDGLISSRGAWSDGRSGWIPPLAIAFTSLAFLCAAQFIYWRGAPLTRVQVSLLSIIFGGVVAVVALSLCQTIASLQKMAHYQNAQAARRANSGQASR